MKKKFKKWRMKWILFNHGFGNSGGVFHRMGSSYSSTIRFAGGQIIGKIYFHGESESDSIPIESSLLDFKKFVTAHCW